MRQTQQIVSLIPLDRLDQFPLRILEVQLDPCTRRRALDLAVPPSCESALRPAWHGCGKRNSPGVEVKARAKGMTGRMTALAAMREGPGMADVDICAEAGLERRAGRRLKREVAGRVMVMRAACLLQA